MGELVLSNLDSVLADDTELIESVCKASDLEKRKSAMSNILSMWTTHYSSSSSSRQFTVSERRCYIDASLNISLGRIKQSFVLTDPHKTHIPIVYASDAFLELTGYARPEVLGRHCRFLSGQETDISTQSQITNSIQTRKACTVCILNYRKDETTFWNRVHMSPVRNASGKIAYFVEVQMDVKRESQNLSPEMRQLSVVGAVKVAVRTSGIIHKCFSIST